MQGGERNPSCSSLSQIKIQELHPAPKKAAPEHSPSPPSTCSSSISFSTPAELSAVPRKQADRHLLCISQRQLQGRGVGAGSRVFSPAHPGERISKRGEKVSNRGREQNNCTDAHVLTCSPSFPFAVTYSKRYFVFKCWGNSKFTYGWGVYKRSEAQYNLVCLQPFWNKEEKGPLRKHLSHSNPQLPPASLWQDAGDEWLEQAKEALACPASAGTSPQDLSPAPQPGSQQADTMVGCATGPHTTGNRWIRTSGKLKSHRKGAAAEQVKSLSWLELELNSASVQGSSSRKSSMQQGKVQFSQSQVPQAQS